MANIKYTIEEIGESVKLENVTDKDMNIALSVLKKVSDAMNVKTGSASEHIEKVKKMGIVLSDEQKKEIIKTFEFSTKYDVDIRKSIGFWGRQANTMRNLLKTLQKG